MTKQDLLNGQEFLFDNGKHIVNNESQKFHTGTISYYEATKDFVIWLDFKIVYSCQSFSVTKKKLDEIFYRFNLEFFES